MALDSIPGTMVLPTLGNLKTVSSTGRENGKRAKKLIVINMKESIRTTKRMGKALLSGLVAINTLEAIKMTRETDMERCFGSTALFIKDSGAKEFNMDKELWSFLMEQ